MVRFPNCEFNNLKKEIIVGMRGFLLLSYRQAFKKDLLGTCLFLIITDTTAMDTKARTIIKVLGNSGTALSAIVKFMVEASTRPMAVSYTHLTLPTNREV